MQREWKFIPPKWLVKLKEVVLSVICNMLSKTDLERMVGSLEICFLVSDPSDEERFSDSIEYLQPPSDIIFPNELCVQFNWHKMICL